jgi:hypothetical protein
MFHAPLFRDPFYDFNRNETWLSELCDNSCRQSLASHRDNVRASCAGAQYYDEFEDTRYMPWYLDEFMIYAYDIACMTRRYAPLSIQVCLFRTKSTPI